MSNEDQLQSTECCPVDLPSDPITEAFPIFVILIAIAWFYSRRNLISGVAEVKSGNIIVVGKETIRIYAMYGLFLGQPWRDRNGVIFDGGSKSKTALAHKIDGKKVKCWYQPKGGSTRGAKICRVYLDGEDVGEWMVRNGYAVADINPKRRNVYLRAEKRARKERLGIHQGTFLHPWRWLLIVNQRKNERIRNILNQIDLKKFDDDNIDLDDVFDVGMRVLRFLFDGGTTEMLEGAELIGELITES